MILKSVFILSVMVAGVVSGSLFSCNGKGTDPVDPPSVDLFIADTYDIVPGDSVLLTYMATNATSIRLDPGAIRLTPNDSGSTYVKPQAPIWYYLTAFNSCCLDTDSLNITMSTAVATIDSLTLSESRIREGDSTQLTWNVSQADSVVVDNGVGKLADPASGSIWLKPTQTTVYTAVAYYLVNDTASVTVTVEVPDRIDAAGGLYFKGEMGSSTLAPQLQFLVVDTSGSIDQKIWIHFELIEGDGQLSADSMLPAAGGSVYPTYNFSGSLGHAIVRAKVPGVDSIDVYLRANTLIPGLGGQGQYIKFVEPYSTVLNFNGTPERVDYSFPLHYVVYEQSLGVVIMVLDDIPDEQITLTEPVYGVIVNTVYEKTTADGIGVGSHINDVIAVYGQPDTTYLDPTPPAADVYLYDDPPMDYFADPSDSVIFEIHIKAPVAEGSPWFPGGIQKAAAGASKKAPGTSYRPAVSPTR